VNKNVTVALSSFILLSSFVYAKSNLCEHACGRIQETTKSSWLKAGAYMTYEQLFVWSMHNETDYMTWNITRLEDDIADLHLISHGINVTDGNVTLTTGEINLTINVSTREVIICSDPSYVGEKWPFWIKENVTCGSEIDIWYGTSIISKDEQIHVLGEERDCWVVEYNWTTACMKRWYDKTSGVVLKIHVILYPENITIATTETAILTSVDLPVHRSVHNLDTRLNYTTIQEAIDANETSDGHTIFVEEGTYYENVVVNKSLSLVGENSSTTIIDGNMTGDVVRITQDHVDITGFTVQRSGRALFNSGISISSTGHCNISGNHIVENEVGVYGSPKNTSISNNAITNNRIGVAIDPGATCNAISRNHLIGNTVSMHFYYANSNNISKNNMTNNWRSITLGYSRNNRFYHNNFFNNTKQILIFPSTYANFWDNGLEGNYWDNYTSVDSNYDGIGDSPFILDVDNTDNFPLMGAFSEFDITSEYSIQAICNFTISDFQFNGTAISFDVSGEAGTLGFCRICIPKVLMNETYRVFVDGTEILSAPLPLPCSNDTHNYMYFNYTHSTQEIVIIVEFPSFLILPLFMIATLLAIIVYKENISCRIPGLPDK